MQGKNITPPNKSATQGAELAYFSETCHRLNCKDCPSIWKRGHFKSSQTGTRYKKHFVAPDCEVVNAVYLITCKNCGSQYVGETKRRVILRWKEHHRDIKNKKDTPVCSHFNTPQHVFEEATKEIIDVIRGNPADARIESLRLKRETYWIITLQTLSPLGINGRLGRPISSSWWV